MDEFRTDRFIIAICPLMTLLTGLTIERASAQVPPVVIARPHRPLAAQRHQAPPVKSLANISVTPPTLRGDMPPDLSEGLFSSASPWGSDDHITVFHWMPTNQRHKPLYFDDASLERHGQRVHPPAQPIVSAARFYGTFVVMPVKLLINSPHDTMTTLGQQRPGSPITFRR